MSQQLDKPPPRQPDDLRHHQFVSYGAVCEKRMSETLGVLIAIASSLLGGSAAAVTRYLVTDADAVTLAILRASRPRRS